MVDGLHPSIRQHVGCEQDRPTEQMIELDYIQPPPLLQRIIEQTEVLGFNMASEARTGALA